MDYSVCGRLSCRGLCEDGRATQWNTQSGADSLVRVRELSQQREHTTNAERDVSEAKRAQNDPASTLILRSVRKSKLHKVNVTLVPGML